MLRRPVRILLYTTCKRILHKNIRGSSTVARPDKNYELDKIRNIGVLAHIDAGKTTTTERMLYYSGMIGSMGEVHHGNTVTDFMEQERERGITIQSAAVTFDWKSHRFNLIDTPGHIDFTMEVEQTLGVLDGVVIILDGSAGVEAQTLTVWRQTDIYNIPRIIFINKMDRPDSNFDMNLKSIERKLQFLPLPVQIPIRRENDFLGMVDLITLEKLTFDKKHQGKIVQRTKLDEHEDSTLYLEAVEKRKDLTDRLSELDDNLANMVIRENSLENIPAQALVDALRQATINGKAVPVLLGSAYKNIGVQPLMDSVILYLPSAKESRVARKYRCFGNNMSARAFKIIHDKQRGALTFLRIYSGSLSKGQKVYNVQTQKSEVINKIYTAYADDYDDVEEMGCGNIVAVRGLQHTTTGHLISSTAAAANRAAAAASQRDKDDLNSRDVNNLFALSTRIPEPVFFCSIEPPSLSQQQDLENALRQLAREDPSLRVTFNEETEQTVLGGMGELHIEIVKQRILSEYKIDVELGPLQIAYKETICKEIRDSHTVRHVIGAKKQFVHVVLSVIPNYEGREHLLFDKTAESASNLANINPRVIQAVRNGVASGLAHGPTAGCPLVKVAAKLHWLEVGRGTAETIVSAAVGQCIRKLLQEAESILLQPIMRLEVVVPDSYSSGVVNDLSKRKGQIEHVDLRGENKVVKTFVPLAELLGYSKSLRILTSGTAAFSMEFDHYESMNSMDEQEALRRITGL